MVKPSMEITFAYFQYTWKSVLASFCLIPQCGWTKDHPEYYLQSILILLLLLLQSIVILFQKLSLYSLASESGETGERQSLLCKKMDIRMLFLKCNEMI